MLIHTMGANAPMSQSEYPKFSFLLKVSENRCFQVFLSCHVDSLFWPRGLYMIPYGHYLSSVQSSEKGKSATSSRCNPFSNYLLWVWKEIVNEQYATVWAFQKNHTKIWQFVSTKHIENLCVLIIYFFSLLI
jgi:hypothetical protein